MLSLRANTILDRVPEYLGRYRQCNKASPQVPYRILPDVLRLRICKHNRSEGRMTGSRKQLVLELLMRGSSTRPHDLHRQEPHLTRFGLRRLWPSLISPSGLWPSLDSTNSGNSRYDQIEIGALLHFADSFLVGFKFSCEQYPLSCCSIYRVTHPSFLDVVELALNFGQYDPCFYRLGGVFFDAIDELNPNQSSD